MTQFLLKFVTFEDLYNIVFRKKFRIAQGICMNDRNEGRFGNIIKHACESAVHFTPPIFYKNNIYISSWIASEDISFNMINTYSQDHSKIIIRAKKDKISELINANMDKIDNQIKGNDQSCLEYPCVHISEGPVTYLRLSEHQAYMQQQCEINLNKFFLANDDSIKEHLAQKVFSYHNGDRDIDFSLIKGQEFSPENEFRFFIHYLGSCDCPNTCKNFKFSSESNLKNLYLEIFEDIIDTIIFDSEMKSYTREVYEDLFSGKCKRIKTENFISCFD